MPGKKTAKITRDAASAKNAYATPALEKGLDVIELLAHESGGLTKSEISRRLNRTVSEIFRMLRCLESRGYIAQSDGDRYALTLKLFKLGQEHPPTERLITEALPMMHRVTHDIRQSCHMGIIEGAQVIILAQVNAPTSVGFYVKLGSTVDLMEATSGYVILAYQEEEQRARTIAEWKRLTGRETPENLESHLARVRRQGYEKRASYKVHGVVNISFPIFDERGSALGALTVPYIQHDEANATPAETCNILQRAAREITHVIGGSPPGKKRLLPHSAD
jgi:DNA-binding IclR family transcriptional regulator